MATVKKSTINKLVHLINALREKETIGGEISDICREFSVGAPYIKEMIARKILVPDGLGCFIFQDNSNTENLATSIALRVAEKTKNTHFHSESNTPANLIPFDDAVKFASDGALLGLSFGIPSDKIPDFILQISDLFKSYIKNKS